MADKLDIHVTPESIERNFMLLNRILEENEAKLQGAIKTSDVELQTQAIKNEINEYITEQIRVLNNRINVRLQVLQNVTDQLEADIANTINDVQIIKENIAIIEQQIQENSQRLKDVEQAVQTIETQVTGLETKVSGLGIEVADILSRLAVLESPGTGGE